MGERRPCHGICDEHGLGSRAASCKQFLRDKLVEHKAYIERYGEDMPEIRNWRWEGRATRNAKQT